MGSEKHKKSHKRKHSDDSDSSASADSGDTRLRKAYQQPSSDSLLGTDVSHQHKKSKKHKKEKDKKVLMSICVHYCRICQINRRRRLIQQHELACRKNTRSLRRMTSC